MSAMAPVFAQFNLVVSDMEATVGFYRLLGLVIPDADPPWEAWQLHHRAADFGGFKLEFDSIAFASRWNAGWPMDRANGGMSVLGFSLPTRDAVDSLFEAVVSAGYRAQQPPYDSFWGSRYAVVEDPDGNAVGLMSPPEDGMRRPPELP